MTGTMRATLDRWYAFNYVHMLREDPRSRNMAVLLVEGDSDVLAMDCAIDTERCERIPESGRDEVLAALSMLNEDGSHGVLAVVDSDFWRLDGNRPSTENLISTDWHDMECILIWSAALGRVLRECLFEEHAPTVSEVRECLVKCTLPIGTLLWLAQKPWLKGSLNLKNLPYDRLIDLNSDSVNLEALVKASLKTSNNQHANIILGQLKKELGVRRDVRQVCRGHDLTTVLALKLGATWGKAFARRLNRGTIESMLRLALQLEDFSKTDMYGNMLDWQNKNLAYRFLKEPMPIQCTRASKGSPDV